MTLQQIRKEVEKATGIKDISVKSRERNLVIARCIYCHLAYRNTLNSLSKIGKEIKRDHATVLHSINSLKNHLLYEPAFKDVFDKLSDQMRSKRKSIMQREEDREQLSKIIRDMPERNYRKAIKLLQEL